MKAIIGEGKQDQTQQCAITFRRLVILLEIVKQIRRPRRIRKLKLRFLEGRNPNWKIWGLNFQCVSSSYTLKPVIKIIELERSVLFLIPVQHIMSSRIGNNV